MLIEHDGARPRVDPTAWVAPTAVLSGDVTVGPGSRVLHGAVLTAEFGAELVLGAGCVVMEQAVLRASGRFPLHVGDRVLVGPHAYLTGCTVGSGSFLATGSMLFNGASLGPGCRVSLQGVVHVGCELPAGTHVPIAYIAVGRPARILPPDDSPSAHDALAGVDGGFFNYVFGVEQRGRAMSDVAEEAIRKYARALGAHQGDTVVDGSGPADQAPPR